MCRDMGHGSEAYEEETRGEYGVLAQAAYAHEYTSRLPFVMQAEQSFRDTFQQNSKTPEFCRHV